jgi:tRNA(Ile)-lysidine synthase
MLARVLKTISRYNMLPAGVRVIAAVSGGADSVCLLHVLNELAPASLAGVAHFNHKWRPEASDEDEQFVADLARQLKLPFFRGELTRVAGNREQEARRARQKFFATLGATIALGHTRDDQAETVLFRFLRGSGLAGLSGIAPVSTALIRPLINTTRDEVEQYLRSHNIPWREDATNQDLTFARNRIRHDLLPQLAREWNPKIVDALANLADLAYEEEQVPDLPIPTTCGARGFYPQVGQVPDLSTTGELPATVLSEPRAQARRQIRQAIKQAKGDLRRIDFDHIESIFEIHRTLTLPGVTVTKSFGVLKFSPTPSPSPNPPQIITPPGKFPSPDGLSQICVDITQVSDPNACATLGMEACWFQSCSPLVLRGWRPGDHYRPAGQSRDRKIQEMFQKARVPSWRRASWPILTSGDKILWSRQFGVAEEFRSAGGNRTVLSIREVL